MSNYSKDESLQNLLSGLNVNPGTYFADSNEALRKFLKECMERGEFDDELARKINVLATTIRVSQSIFDDLIKEIEARVQ